MGGIFGKDDLSYDKQKYKSFFDFKHNDIDGNEIDFNKFRGSMVLICNTASK